MIRRLSIVLLSFASIALFATAERRMLSNELVPFSRSQIENSSFWNFNTQNVLDDKNRAYVRRAGNIVYENADGLCRAYLLRGDTVCYRGRNAGRKEHMLADSIVDVYRLPDGFSSSYSAHGLLGMDFPLSADGMVECRVFGPGAMVVGADTLLRVYVVAESHVEYSPSQDSPTDSSRQLIYKWLCEDSPVPIALQIEDTDSKHLFLSNISDMADGMGEHEGIEGDMAVLCMLGDAVVRIDGSNVVIDFGANIIDAAIEASVVDINGLYLFHDCLKIHKGGEASFSITIPSYLRGRCIVVLAYRDNPQIIRKIFVEL